jgi:hypothetical protein
MSENRKIINVMETKLIKFSKPRSDNSLVYDIKETEVENKLFSTNNIENDSLEFNTNDIFTNNPNEVAGLKFVPKSVVYFHCSKCGLVVGNESIYCYK